MRAILLVAVAAGAMGRPAARAEEPVTYTDARGVRHTTSSAEQIACERDRCA